MNIISNTKYKLSFFSLISKKSLISLIKISLTVNQNWDCLSERTHDSDNQSNNSNHNKYGIDQ
jgi:hypothetical protein